MSLKEKTIQEVEHRIKNIEKAIAKNGIGSSYLSKAERVQRDVNIGLAIGGLALIAGVTAWALIRDAED